MSAPGHLTAGQSDGSPNCVSESGAMFIGRSRVSTGSPKRSDQKNEASDFVTN